MSPAPMKSNAIRRLVKLKQALKRWRNISSAASGRFVPPDVPSGHIAVYVGAEFKRFVVRATYLNHPHFKYLLAQAEEEFGFASQGPLVIPCDESEFEDALHSVSSPRDSNRGLLGKRCNSRDDFFSDSLPMANRKSVC